MELTLQKREAKTKGANTKTRIEGGIPGVIYGQTASEGALAIKAEKAEVEALLRKIPKGHLATTVLSLTLGKEKFKALVKDIQYHLTTYDIMHMDFLKVAEDKEVTVKVPLEFEGREECAGVKMGGTFRIVSRFVTVKCLPKDIPAKFAINVLDLNIMQSKRVSDLEVPANVRILDDSKQVTVIIGKKKG